MVTNNRASRPYLWIFPMAALIASRFVCAWTVHDAAVFLAITLGLGGLAMMANIISRHIRRTVFAAATVNMSMWQRYDRHFWIAASAGVGSHALPITSMHALVLWLVATGIGWTIVSLVPAAGKSLD